MQNRVSLLLFLIAGILWHFCYYWTVHSVDLTGFRAEGYGVGDMEELDKLAMLWSHDQHLKPLGQQDAIITGSC